VQIDCWVTPNSSGVSSNGDGVRIAADIGTSTQTLSLSDLLTTTAPTDQLDLVCSLSQQGNPGGQAKVTHASIIATGITNATTAITHG
jgi:hypothetical protein